MAIWVKLGKNLDKFGYIRVLKQNLAIYVKLI